jgi:hypothetical protein
MTGKGDKVVQSGCYYWNIKREVDLLFRLGGVDFYLQGRERKNLYLGVAPGHYLLSRSVF